MYLGLFLASTKNRLKKGGRRDSERVVEWVVEWVWEWVWEWVVCYGCVCGVKRCKSGYVLKKNFTLIKGCIYLCWVVCGVLFLCWDAYFSLFFFIFLLTFLFGHVILWLFAVKIA